MPQPQRGIINLYEPVVYEIKIPGALDARWSAWAHDMTILVTQKDDGGTVTSLVGRVDQAGLHSVLRRLYALGLPLISVHCLGSD